MNVETVPPVWAHLPGDDFKQRGGSLVEDNALAKFFVMGDVPANIDASGDRPPVRRIVVVGTAKNIIAGRVMFRCLFSCRAVLPTRRTSRSIDFL